MNGDRAPGAPPFAGAPGAVLLLGLTAVYFLAGKLGLAVPSIHASASSVWPPTGIALAATLLFGYRVWPAILTGAFLVNVTTAGSVATSIGIATGNTLEAMAGAWLVFRYAGGARVFERPQGVFQFALLAAMASTIVSASVGVGSLWLGGFAESGDLSGIWLTWWLGDAVGAMVFTPLLVLWARPMGPGRPARGPVETAALAVTLVGVAWIVFRHLLPLALLGITPLIWAAFRFGRRGAATASAILAGIALWGTLSGSGPFARESAYESLLFLQAFVGVATALALVLAADTRERERVEAALREARADLEEKVRTRTASLEKAVRLLEKSRSGLEEAQRVAHIGSWEWDVAEDRVAWSDELYRIYGLEPGAVPITYEAYLERVHPEDRETVAAAIRDALERGGTFEFEERIVRPDGRVRVLRSKGYLVRGPSGEPVRMIGTCHDVTERKVAEIELERRMEDLARSNAELSIFTHVASHDLREPLRTVASNVQLVDRRLTGADDPAVRRSIAYAVEGVRQMDALITALLEYSRAERPRKSEIDAGLALAEALEFLGSAIDESGARVETGELPRVEADPSRLVQLFQNLVSNAIKYRDPDRTPEIRIGAEPHGSKWLFEVADNGRGFEPSAAERIFVVFERLDRDRREIPGTGLGLAICRRIVEAHGGRIWAESKPGEGSVFRFTLPAGGEDGDETAGGPG